jgi:hypothetical protein
MHQLALHGAWRAALLWLSDALNRLSRPRIRMIDRGIALATRRYRGIRLQCPKPRKRLRRFRRIVTRVVAGCSGVCQNFGAWRAFSPSDHVHREYWRSGMSARTRMKLASLAMSQQGQPPATGIRPPRTPRWGT